MSDVWQKHIPKISPNYSPILVAMKPNEGSYAENAIKYGVSGLNIDGGRIPANWKEERPPSWFNSGTSKSGNPTYGGNLKTITDSSVGDRLSDKGRFPANIILDEEAGNMLDEQSGEMTPSFRKGDRASNKDGIVPWNKGRISGRSVKGAGFNDKGGASRFFYCAKSSKAERNMGCEELESKLGGSLEGGNDKRNGADKPQLKETKNNHPTVKPLKLMEYLCILTKTPTGGLVLDPFTGSGTTLMACKRTGRDYIGIEQDKEYCKIAEARVKAVKIDNKLF